MIASPLLPTPRIIVPAYTRQRVVWDALLVLACALGLRLVFAALTASTYDPDEFVLLTLSRDYTHGATPYRDFAFFHPPGVLVLLRALQPLVSWWWPSARMLMLMVDSMSAILVWRIGTLLYGRKEGLAAGLLYAASPVALLAAVRIGQDSLITALALIGLFLLVSLRSLLGAVLAGICLGLAVWFKYPALLFLPVYALAAPRRAYISVLATASTIVALFVPFAHELHALYNQTFEWQLFLRSHQDTAQRVAAGVCFWLLLNPLTVPAALRGRAPLWVWVGFALGGFFLGASQVYYHYFVLAVPCAALLAAPLLLRAMRKAPRLLLAGGVAQLGLWAAALNVGPIAADLGFLRLSATDAVVRILDRATSRGERVLTDQFAFPYLAHRPLATDYFWNANSITSTRSLQRCLSVTAAVVSTTKSGSAYPPGFVSYLTHQRYLHIDTGSGTVWLVPQRRGSPQAFQTLPSHPDRRCLRRS